MITEWLEKRRARRPTHRQRPSQMPDKLNIGCGFDRREGYLNVDLHHWHNPDLVADASDLRMLPDDHFQEIVAYDLLEHLPRAQTMTVLCEWNRVLRRKGLLKVRVPDLISVLRLLADPANADVEEQERLVRCVYGTQNYSGDAHLTGFTRTLLEHYLKRAGFVVLSMSSVDDWMMEVIAWKASAPDQQTNGTARFRLDDLIAIPDDGEFVKLCYLHLLKRDPDQEGLRHYLSLMSTGAANRRQIVQTIMDSEEYARVTEAE